MYILLKSFKMDWKRFKSIDCILRSGCRIDRKYTDVSPYIYNGIILLDGKKRRSIHILKENAIDIRPIDLMRFETDSIFQNHSGRCFVCGNWCGDFKPILTLSHKICRI